MPRHSPAATSREMSLIAVKSRPSVWALERDHRRRKGAISRADGSAQMVYILVTFRREIRGWLSLGSGGDMDGTRERVLAVSRQPEVQGEAGPAKARLTMAKAGGEK